MQENSDKYEKYKNYVLKPEIIPIDFEKDFVNRVISPMNKGDRLFYIWDENYNSYPINSMEAYRKIPVMTGSISKMNVDAFTLSEKYLKLERGYQLKYYKVFIFKK